MKVLLDTNIVIHREANNVVNGEIGILFKWFDNLYDINLKSESKFLYLV